jgi:small subunit ribosomal protein S8
MTMSDPLGDMLTRIRNGQQVQKPTIACPWSKHKEAVCEVLKEEGYIVEYAVQDLENNKKELIVTLKYETDGQGAIREMHRVSKPGRRVYSNSKTMPSFYNGLGVTVVSTPNGVMSDQKAKTENVGGEVLCQIF